MLKGLLLSLVLAACACAGRALSNGKKRRAELLGELLAGLRVLRLRMLNSMEPLGILLRKSDVQLLRRLGDGLWEGGGLQEGWEQLRREESRRGRGLDALTGGDLSLLDEFFQKLGGSGREEQSELFSQIIARMEEAHSAAKSEYLEAARTFTALGALAGVGVCIILL